MAEKKDSATNDELILNILTKADVFTPEGGIKPSEYWAYRENVRIKYGLPECADKWDFPVSYIQKIEQLAKENKIEIRPKHEFQLFFEENKAGALTSKSVFRDNTIIAEQHQPDDWWALRARANQLSHEIVHALQNIMFPGMPDHIAEQEAYAYQQFNPGEIIYKSYSPEDIASWVNKTIPEWVATSLAVDNKLNQHDKIDE